MSATHVDIIAVYTAGGTDEYSHLQSLCENHHRQKSGGEGGIASGASRRAKRDAAKPTHPGLLAPATAQNDGDLPPF